jgi:hypothetical protein
LDWSFWRRVWEALQRVIALAVFIVIHKALDRLMEWIVPNNWPGALDLFKVLTYLTFLWIYCVLCWEMGKVFANRKAEDTRHGDVSGGQNKAK